MAETSIFLSISLSNQSYESFNIGAISVNGNIYYDWNYGEVSKESLSCEDADSEEQISDDCVDKEPEWYKDLREHGPDCLKPDTVLNDDEDMEVI